MSKYYKQIFTSEDWEIINIPDDFPDNPNLMNTEQLEQYSKLVSEHKKSYNMRAGLVKSADNKHSVYYENLYRDENYWGASLSEYLQKPPIRSPRVILVEQSTRLDHIVDGKLCCRVRTQLDGIHNDTCKHTLTISNTNYSLDLITLEHKLCSLYPTTVYTYSQGDYRCDYEYRLESDLRSIMSSPIMWNIIYSAIHY